MLVFHLYLSRGKTIDLSFTLRQRRLPKEREGFFQTHPVSDTQEVAQ
jgi:hypothetical protein